ncbi:MAG: Hsp20/alpha crystallin family protein [Sulfuricaulis sp.]|uniref:Hsp20/alpha crystallin family protein n=1 Tax=Sulfuricaulis sp. TaxID=2003553 RepID=UPI0034A486E9
MTRLMRRDDRTPLARWGLWDNDIDRVFQGFLSPMRWVEEARGEDLFPAMDMKERDDAYVIIADVPGAKKEDIDVTLENGILTITAETKSETEEKEGERVLRQERRYGKYVRSLRLGTQIEEKGVKANYKDGVLELTLPKAEEVKPKKISVDVD